MAHTLANTLLLTRKRKIRLEWITSQARVTALFAGEIGTYPAVNGTSISVLAVGAAAICTSSGLRWPLAGPLNSGTTRGISNEIVAAAATVTVVEGQVMIIHERN